MTEFFAEYWWLIICTVCALFFAVRNTKKYLNDENNKSLTKREITGLISITLTVLVLGILVFTGVIDGKY